MKTCRALLVAFGLAATLSPVWSASKSASDLVSPQRRQQSVDLARGLTRRASPAPLPADLAQPFNPQNFDQPDPEEQKSSPGSAAPVASGATTPAAPVGDRDLLESLAARIPSSGTFVLGGKSILVVGKHRLEVGQSFVVPHPATGQDCELELVAIDRTTFTLRYRGEEITRPIKSSK